MLVAKKDSIQKNYWWGLAQPATPPRSLRVSQTKELKSGTSIFVLHQVLTRRDEGRSENVFYL